MKFNILQSLLFESNVNSLTSKLQKEFTSKSYNELSSEEKIKLQEFLNKRKLEIEQEVSNITSDLTYKSWIYDLLLNDSIVFPEDSEKTKELLEKYTISKRKSSFPSDQKNILNFKTFGDLYKVVSEFLSKDQEEQMDIGENTLVYNEGPWKIVKLDDFEKSQCVTSQSGWCIKGRHWWNEYKPPYFAFYYRNKKFGLLHFKSEQFKDVSDKAIKNVEDKDGLMRTFNWLNEKYNHDKIDWDEDSDIFKLLIVNDKDFWKKLEKSLIENANNESFIKACRYGLIEAVKLLLSDKRVDPSDYDNSAIRLASQYGHLEVVKVLKEDPRVRAKLKE